MNDRTRIGGTSAQTCHGYIGFMPLSKPPSEPFVIDPGAMPDSNDAQAGCRSKLGRMASQESVRSRYYYCLHQLSSNIGEMSR